MLKVYHTPSGVAGYLILSPGPRDERDSKGGWVAPGRGTVPDSPLPSLAGISSSALRRTWVACASPTLMLPQRFLNKVPSSDSGPARNGLLSVSPMCPSCVPTRSHQSRSRDGKAVTGFSTYFPFYF